MIKIEGSRGDRSIYVPYEKFVFPGGEIQVRLTDLNEINNWRPYAFVIHADLRSADEIMELFLVTDAVRREFNTPEIGLVLPYVPYARQDRVCYPGESNASLVFASLINEMGYYRVEIWDPHSSVVAKAINNVEVVEAADLLFNNTYIPPEHRQVICAPDKGARKRAQKVVDLCHGKLITADKIRDPSNGKIAGIHLPDTGDLNRANVTIVDDICDGGRTFIELAKVLSEKHNAGQIVLAVTHGIFSAGFAPLNDWINHIYVANCFVDDPPSDYVTVIHK